MGVLYIILNFLVATFFKKLKETDKIKYNHVLFNSIIQHFIFSICNQYKMNEVFYIIFFLISFQHLVCISHLLNISVRTSHILSAQ